MRVFAFVWASALLLSGCSQGVDGLNGVWNVSTDMMMMPGGRVEYLTGTLLISDGPEGAKQCSLSMRSHSYTPWVGFKLGDYEESAAQQSCQVVRTGDQVVIHSKVESASETYVPDNFELTLNGDEMTGRLVSSQSAPARLTRKGSTAQEPSPPEGFLGRVSLSKQPEGWFDFATTTKGCALSYRSPLGITTAPAAIRVWIKSSCGGTTNDGTAYSESQAQVWYVCADNKLYTEQEHYLRDGEIVADWTPTSYGYAVNGPTMREMGIGGTILQPDAAYRELFNKVCA